MSCGGCVNDAVAMFGSYLERGGRFQLSGRPFAFNVLLRTVNWLLLFLENRAVREQRFVPRRLVWQTTDVEVFAVQIVFNGCVDFEEVHCVAGEDRFAIER